MKFTDEIFMKHRKNLGPSGKVFVRVRQNVKGATLHVKWSRYIFGKKTIQPRNTTSITRCSLIGKDFSINFVIIVITGIGPAEGATAPRLMYLCTSAFHAHHDKLWYHRCKRCHDELFGNIIEKYISSTSINTIVRTAKKFLFHRYSVDFCHLKVKSNNSNLFAL